VELLARVDLGVDDLMHEVFLARMQAEQSRNYAPLALLHDLNRRRIVQDEPIHLERILGLSLVSELSLVSLAEFDNLRILVVGLVKDVELHSVLCPQLMCHYSYQIEALAAVVALLIQDDQLPLVEGRLGGDALLNPLGVLFGFRKLLYEGLGTW